MNSLDSLNTAHPASSTRIAAPVVALDDVRKTFGPVTAVDGLSLTIEPGEIVAFLGPNGAGKTTTIDMILGLSTPTAGTARVFGLEPADAVAAGLVSAVMQTGGLLKEYTVRETVVLVSTLFRDTRPVDEVLRRAGIESIADRLVGKCSGGEQQRLRFALALLPDPRLLILDEPTTGMDVGGRRDFWSAIRADAAHGRTVLFATHYLEEADLYADRIVLVRDGRVVADGTAAEVKGKASGRLVRASWPGADVDALRGIAGVESVERRGDTVLVRGQTSDDVARYLLTQTSASDLEISASNLEDAFVALTTTAPTQGAPA
jgi:ABC-2 type transport system ATP-binding protein